MFLSKYFRQMLYLVQIFSANIVCGSNIVFGPNILSKYIIYFIFSANIVFGSNIWLEVRGSEGGPFELPGLTLKNHKKRKKKRKLIFSRLNTILPMFVHTQYFKILVSQLTSGVWGQGFNSSHQAKACRSIFSLTSRQCHRLPICFLTSHLTNRNKNQRTLIVRRTGFCIGTIYF